MMSNQQRTIDEFKERLDLLWALYDLLSDKEHVLALGNFNGDLGDSLGDKESILQINAVQNYSTLQIISISALQIFLGYNYTVRFIVSILLY